MVNGVRQTTPKRGAPPPRCCCTPRCQHAPCALCNPCPCGAPHAVPPPAHVLPPMRCHPCGASHAVPAMRCHPCGATHLELALAFGLADVRLQGRGEVLHTQKTSNGTRRTALGDVSTPNIFCSSRGAENNHRYTAVGVCVSARESVCVRAWACACLFLASALGHARVCSHLQTKAQETVSPARQAPVHARAPECSSPIIAQTNHMPMTARPFQSCVCNSRASVGWEAHALPCLACRGVCDA